jgi:hypothetical protein
MSAAESNCDATREPHLSLAASDVDRRQGDCALAPPRGITARSARGRRPLHPRFHIESAIHARDARRNLVQAKNGRCT